MHSYIAPFKGVWPQLTAKECARDRKPYMEVRDTYALPSKTVECYTPEKKYAI